MYTGRHERTALLEGDYFGLGRGSPTAAGFAPLRGRAPASMGPERLTERRIGRFIHEFQGLFHITPNAPERF